MTRRLPFPREELRRRTVRGAAVNAAFLVGVDLLVLAQGLIVMRLLGPTAIGLYGIVTVTVMTIVALKRIGVDEAYVAQDAAESEQEAEFQRAFTVDLAFSAGLALVVALLAPVLVAVHGEPRLLGLTLAVAYLPIAFALQAPLWIFFRRMDFVRQRLLQAVVPVVTFVVTLPLAAAGAGVWSLVLGPLAGNAAGVAAAIACSPYPLRIRWERAAVRRYARFSSYVLVALAGALIVQQGQVLAFSLDAGVRAAGFITVAVTLTRYADRAGQIVTTTLYPAICAVREGWDELFELSNRAALAWALPFAAALVLFAPDLVAFVLGDAWAPATVLVQGLAVAGGVGQLGYNWFSFYRAAGDTRPEAIEAATAVAAFLALAVPGLALAGATGFAAGRVAGAGVALAVRARYLRRLVPRARLGRIALAAAVPVCAGTGAVLAVRWVTWGGERSLEHATIEVAIFVLVWGTTALRREGALVREVRAAVR